MRFAWSLSLTLLAAFAFIAPVGSAGQKEKVEEKLIDTGKGKFVLKFIELVPGTGKEAKKGDNIEVDYTGWLTNDTKFDSSIGRKPLPFTLGAGQVIKGWDEGVVGMKEGGKRKLIIPPELAYGKKNVANGLIPPDSTLIFEVELLKVK